MHAMITNKTVTVFRQKHKIDPVNDRDVYPIVLDIPKPLTDEEMERLLAWATAIISDADMENKS